MGSALQPLFHALRIQLLTAPVLHADETPVAQLDPGAGKIKRAYLFVYRRAGPYPIVLFDYGPTRAGKHAAAFLGDWKGALMVDDYAGYKALFAKGVTELGCWAHARRKFFDTHAASASPVAKEAIKHIGEIYATDNALADLDHDERYRERQRVLAPKLAAFKQWLDELQPKVLGSTGLAGAIGYTLKAAKRGRRELSTVELTIRTSRPAAVPELDRTSKRLFHHGLELDVAQRAFLLQVCANVLQFVVANAFAQPGAIGVRTYLWINVLGEERRVRSYQWVVNQPKVRV